MNIILLSMIFLSLFGSETPLLPPLDPDCISEPFFVREFPNHQWCNAQEDPFGDYYSYACRVIKHSDRFGEYESFKFVHQCIYTPTLEIPVAEIYITLLPLVNKYPATIGQPIP